MHDILMLILGEWRGPIMVVVLIAAICSDVLYVGFVKGWSACSSLDKDLKLLGGVTCLLTWYLFDVGFSAAQTMLDYFPDSSVIAASFLVAWASFFISFQFAACRLIAGMPDSLRPMETYWMLLPIFTPAAPLLAFAVCKLLEKSPFSFAEHVSSFEAVFPFAVSCIYSTFWLYSKKTDKLKR